MYSPGGPGHRPWRAGRTCAHSHRGHRWWTTDENEAGESNSANLGAMIARNRSANNNSDDGGGSEYDECLCGRHSSRAAPRTRRAMAPDITIGPPTRKAVRRPVGLAPIQAPFFSASALRGDPGIDPLRQHLRSVAKGVDKWRMRAKDH
ncbi:hypothetical protein niasHT_027873 [Heterodera trifolii]|uniref:Uncharacterized protein n=1 Tax=Heterodera trifolii TaxID=157864 RepID=A0ABD2KJG6_9BILA